MSPFGGPTIQGFVDTEENREETRRFFTSGEATVEVEHVLVLRRPGRVRGHRAPARRGRRDPDQDWSLRVTLVFRHDASGWALAHRHADPLVHAIPFETLGVLARSEYGVPVG